MAQGKIDIEMPGAPKGPTGPVWDSKAQPWRDQKDPWPGDTSPDNEGGRTSVPGGKDPDGSGPGSTGVTNTAVPI